jgi:2-dehydro-3-deoxygluconokinase
MIQTDSLGERSFSYWRETSAAKLWFSDIEQLDTLFNALTGYDVIYLSGITLSLMSDQYFEKFIHRISQLNRKNVKIAFDINFRPRGWVSYEKAKNRINAILALTSIALPTWDDEVVLYGDKTPQTTLNRYLSHGIQECIVKLGSEGALCDGVIIPTKPIERVIDTTGAGDSFNAGYLATRVAGKSPQQACLEGHRLAGEVIQHRGAVIDIAVMPKALIFES